MNHSIRCKTKNSGISFHVIVFRGSGMC